MHSCVQIPSSPDINSIVSKKKEHRHGPRPGHRLRVCLGLLVRPKGLVDISFGFDS